jgi:hypothetical protein
VAARWLRNHQKQLSNHPRDRPRSDTEDGSAVFLEPS